MECHRSQCQYNKGTKIYSIKGMYIGIVATDPLRDNEVSGFLYCCPSSIGGISYSFFLPNHANLLSPILNTLHLTPKQSHLDMSKTMDSIGVQDSMHDVQPTSGTSHSFENVPLSPLHEEDQSPHTPGEFFHVPLEHEVIASRSVWDDAATSDELNDKQSINSTRFSEQGSPTAAASIPGEYSLTAVDDQVQSPSDDSRDPEQVESSPTSTVLDPRSDLAWIPDPLTPSIANAGTLGERPVTPNKIPGSIAEGIKFPFSTESPRDRKLDPLVSESDISDISDEIFKSSEPINKSTAPTVPIPPAAVISHATFPRPERPESSSISTSIPEFFEIPIPIFPFAAGTTRCNSRQCPIKGHHEQGPYLHEGKLRSREGSIFGSSNPPPEIWFLYDMLKEGDLQGTGRKAFAPVELFVKFHFGETRGEYVCGSGEAGGSAQQGAKGGGKKTRFWRFWG